MKVKNVLSDDGDVIAMVVKKQDAQSVNFLTPETFPLQVAVSGYSKGSRIKPHTHNRIKRRLDVSQEVVYVEKGRTRVRFYDNQGKEVDSEVLTSGDIVFFASGGHGFDMLANTRIVEVKQGPFFGTEKEKSFLNSGTK